MFKSEIYVSKFLYVSYFHLIIIVCSRKTRQSQNGQEVRDHSRTGRFVRGI